MTILEIQKVLMDAGWQWQERIFNDGWHNCYIELTRSKDPHCLSNYPRPKDCVGWGRFDRQYCWESAYNYIINGSRD